MHKIPVYLVDDQGEVIIHEFKRYLGDNFEFTLEKHIDQKTVLQFLKDNPDYMIVLLDLYESGEPRGMKVLDAIQKKFCDEVQVIMISSDTQIENVVKAMRYGAIDYIGRKVYENLDDENVKEKFAAKLKGAWEKANGKRGYQRSEKEGLTKYGEGDMVGNCDKMLSVHKIIEKLSRFKDVNILITGETGTGKEVIAKQIRDKGLRQKGPFRPLNIGAIPKTGNFLQVTLFGSEPNITGKGEPARKGIFEDAKGGIVFLDEIGTADSETQTALLRVIQEKEVIPLGAVRPREVDFQLICGTNTDLIASIEKQTFREDLYYRITDVEIDLPPLRERDNDIAQLTWHFLNKYNKDMSRQLQIRNEDMLTLMKHKWPGNVRELQKLIKRSVLLTDDDSAYLQIHFDKRQKEENI